MPSDANTNLIDPLKQACENALHLQSSVDLANRTLSRIDAKGMVAGLSPIECAELCRLIGTILMYAEQPGWQRHYGLAWSLAMQSNDMTLLTKIAANLASIYDGSIAPVPIQRFRYVAVQAGYATAALSDIKCIGIIIATVNGDNQGRNGANAQASRAFAGVSAESRDQLGQYAPGHLSNLLFKEAVASFSTRELRAADKALHACSEQSVGNPYREFECLLLSAAIETLRYNFRSASRYLEDAQNAAGDQALNRTANTKILHTWRTVQSRRTAAGQPFDFFAGRHFDPISVDCIYKLALNLDTTRPLAPDSIRPLLQSFAHAMRIEHYVSQLNHN